MAPKKAAKKAVKKAASKSAAAPKAPKAKSSKSVQAYDSKVIEELQQLLVEKKNSLIDKLYTWEDNSSPSGLKEVGDLADIASEINEEALSSVLSDNEIEMLREIEYALEKIDAGKYGICEGTGKKIPLTRLRAIPWTRYTVEYAEEVSKHKQKFPNQPMRNPGNISGGFSMMDIDMD